MHLPQTRGKKRGESAQNQEERGGDIQAKGREDGSKDRTSLQEVGLTGPQHERRRGHCSDKPSAALDENPKCCRFTCQWARYLPFSVRSLRFSANSSSSSSLLFLSSASCFFSRLIWNCGVCRMSPMGEGGEPERKLRKETAHVPCQSQDAGLKRTA